MIGLSTVAAQEDGSVVLEEDPDRSVFGEAQPRATRSATLDGGCVVIHGGVSDGDRVFRVGATITEEQAENVWAIWESGSLIYLSCRAGYFLGYIADIRCDNGDLELTFYVKEKVSS